MKINPLVKRPSVGAQQWLWGARIWARPYLSRGYQGMPDHELFEYLGTCKQTGFHCFLSLSHGTIERYTEQMLMTHRILRPFLVNFDKLEEQQNAAKGL